MPTDPKLENYLQALDKALGAISISDRSEIVTEIKSHVLDAQEKEPQRGLRDILASLGEPESVANRYLMERGLKPGKPSKTPVVKWLTIGFLGTMGISALFMLVLIWKFTPVISVSDNGVTILGGAINIHGDPKKHGLDQSSDFELDLGDANLAKLQGSQVVDPKKISALKIPFTNGKFSVVEAKDKLLHWECSFAGAKNSAAAKQNGKEFVLDFQKVKKVDCELEVPALLPTNLKGENAHIEFEKVAADLDVSLTNGQVDFTPKAGEKYNYDTRVINGRVEGVAPSSADQGAHKVKIFITNGSIDGNS